MSRPRTYRTEAIVLRQHPIGEADLLLTLFTPQEGKLRAVAKGVRKLTSKLAGHLEPLTRVELSLSVGQGLDVVSQAQMVEGFASVKGDLARTSRALYLAELVDGFAVERSGNPALYGLLLEALALLGQPPSEGGQPPARTGGQEVEPGPLLRCFEVRLLDLSGFRPELGVCVECRQPPEEGQQRYMPDGGGLLCGECAPPRARVMSLSSKALAALRLLDSTSLVQASRLHLAPELVEELRVLLSATIRYWLEREVRSAAFLETLQARSL
ncbi:MAG: DNA repair protein RecO [Chloroflexota bacterium]|nr:DNA repair protein RecO [Chloroflexota bacterium]